MEKVQLLAILETEISIDKWCREHTKTMLELHGKDHYLKHCIRGNVVNTLKFAAKLLMQHMKKIQTGELHPDTPFEVCNELFAKAVHANTRTINNHIIRLIETGAFVMRKKGYCRFGKSEGGWTAEPIRMPSYELNTEFLAFWDSFIQASPPLEPNYDKSTGYQLNLQFLPQTNSSSLTQINAISEARNGVDKSTNLLERVAPQRLPETADATNAEKEKNIQTSADRLRERIGTVAKAANQKTETGAREAKIFSSGVAAAAPRSELGKASERVTELKDKNEHNYTDNLSYTLLLYMLRILYNNCNLSTLHFIQCKEYIYTFLKSYVELNRKAGGKEFKTLIDEAANCFRIRIMLKQENRLKYPKGWLMDPVYYLTRPQGFASSKKAYELYMHNAKLNRKIHKKRKTNLQIFTEQVKLFETNPVEWQYRQCLKTLEATSELYANEFTRFTKVNQIQNTNI